MFWIFVKIVIDLTFSSKGLHIANINVRHILPKLDELRILMEDEKGPDIVGACETFLDINVPDDQIAITGFYCMR